MVETIATAPAVDMARPWPGLDTFTEALSPFFFGRDAEADDLFRLVRRDLVTLLFGQSGLGKTSLLQAGLFPRLRQAGFMPVLIRLDYSAGAPPPAVQVKAAIEREFTIAAEPIPIGAEESLWSYFHRIDQRLVDRTGREIVPVLVFDQFEEIFTHGLGGSESRAASQSFLTELAELAENRPPETLEQAIEVDPEMAENFLFDRQDYRIVLGLREDFLASLEGLRTRAPSIGRNRYRLRRMTGREGLVSILKPVPGLVAPEVAQEIIRFIGRASPEDVFGIAGTGGAAQECEVEPSLLSLVCRELNERRLARRLDQIGSDLLAGSRDDIIEGFYERVLVDQPTALRVFIEDELLSDSGFRESVTLDRAHRVLNDNGVPVAALDELVRRRLLRIEERFGITRIEIIHDVLSPVIRRSRDTRRLRQAETAAAEREVALRRERRRVRHAHWLAAAMALLFFVTVGLAWWGWRSSLEAERQKSIAIGQQRLAEHNLDTAVSTAGELISAVSDRVHPLPGLSVSGVRKLLTTAERTFERLTEWAPASQQIRWRRALMLISFVDTYQALGDTTEALRRAQAARDIMETLTREDAQNPRWQHTLAVSHGRIANVLSDWGDLKGALAEDDAYLKIMSRLADREPGNAEWQLDLARSHRDRGNVLYDQGQLDPSLDEYRAYLNIVEQWVGKESGNAIWQWGLAVSHRSIARVLRDKGDPSAALAEFKASMVINEHLANKNPTNIEWQHDLSVCRIEMGDVRSDLGDMDGSLSDYRASLKIIEPLTQTDPSNTGWQRDLSIVYERIGDLMVKVLDLDGSETNFRMSIEIKKRLAARDPNNILWQRELLASHERLARVLQSRGDPTASLSEEQAANELRKRIIPGADDAPPAEPAYKTPPRGRPGGRVGGASK